MNGPDSAAESMPPHVRVIQLATAIWPSRSIYLAAKLAVADHLANGPRSAKELAQSLDTPLDPLTKLLVSLVSLGLFAMPEAGHFELTRLGRALITGSPGSARAVILLMSRERLPARAALEAGRVVPTLEESDVRPVAILAGSAGVRARRRTV